MRLMDTLEYKQMEEAAAYLGLNRTDDIAVVLTALTLKVKSLEARLDAELPRRPS